MRSEKKKVFTVCAKAGATLELWPFSLVQRCAIIMSGNSEAYWKGGRLSERGREGIHLSKDNMLSMY